MTDRYDELGVTPEPARAEALRQRLHRRMEDGWLDERADGSRLRSAVAPAKSTDEFVPMEEPDMSIEPPDTDHTNRRWIMAVIAAGVVAVVGLAGIAIAIDRNDSDDGGVQQAPVTTSAPTTTIAPRTETGFFAGAEDIPVTFIVPDGWTVPEDGAWAVIGESAGVNFFDVANLYTDGCQWQLLDPPLGPTVDDLATAWAGLSGFTAAPPVDVTVDGYSGKQVEFTVPDFNEDDCRRGQFGLWTEDKPEQSSPNFWAQGPGQQNRQIILDVDGPRLVITALSFAETSPEELAALDQILASIQIG